MTSQNAIDYLSQFPPEIITSKIVPSIMKLFGRKIENDKNQLSQIIEHKRRKLKQLEQRYNFLETVEDDHFNEKIKFSRNDLFMLRQFISIFNDNLGFVSGHRQIWNSDYLTIIYNLDANIPKDCYFPKFHFILKRLTYREEIIFGKNRIKLLGKPHEYLPTPKNTTNLYELLNDNEIYDFSNEEYDSSFSLSRDEFKDIKRRSFGLEKSRKRNRHRKEVWWEINSSFLSIDFFGKRTRYNIEGLVPTVLCTLNFYKHFLLLPYTVRYNENIIRFDNDDIGVSYILKAKKHHTI